MFAKRLFPLFLILTISATSITAYAADTPEAMPNESSSSNITITDITPQQSKASAAFATAEHLPIEIRTEVDDGVKLLIKTYEVTPDLSPVELVEEGITRNGIAYTVRDILRRSLPPTQEQKSAVQTATISADSEKQEDILPLFAPSMDYSEGGYSGQLQLDTGSVTTKVEGTEGYTYTLKDTKEFFGLERNDPYYIPKTSTKNGVTLALCDIQCSPQNGSENLVAPTYSATAIYAGKAYGSKASGYLATAQYSGEVVKETPGNVLYSIVYEAVPAPIIPEGFDWKPILFIFGGLVLLAGLGYVVVFLLSKRKKSRANRLQQDEYLPEPKPQRRKPHALGYMKREENSNVQ